MASTSTDIANDCLHFIGLESVSNIDTDPSKRAQICRRWLPIKRQELFRRHPWNFLIRRAQLAATAETPVFGYAYSFQLPTECLRLYKVQAVNEYDYPECDYKLEGRTIVTNQATCYITYITDTEDYSQMPADIRMALVYGLGVAVAPVLTGKPQITNLCTQAYKEALAEAISADSTENYPDQPLDAEDWVNARF